MTENIEASVIESAPIDASQTDRYRTPHDRDALPDEHKRMEFERVLALEARILPTKKKRAGRRGFSARTIVQKAQMEMFELERRGHFSSMPAQPSNEYPSVLARIPIFLPVTRKTQRGMLDVDNAIKFESGWGSGKRHGPNLSIYDEDTLLALFGLRQRLLYGRPEKLPIPMPGMPVQQGESADPEREVGVYTLHTTISEIETFLGRSKNGRGYQRRLASVRRLAATKLEFERCSDKRVTRGFSTSLLELAWERYEEDGVLFIEIAPLIALWLRDAYSYIDLNVRSKLSDAGKAIHRFLSSEGKGIDIFEETLRRAIGYQQSKKEFMRDLRKTMATLESIGWCRYDIEGNGRTEPFKLIFRRRYKKNIHKTG